MKTAIFLKRSFLLVVFIGTAIDLSAQDCLMPAGSAWLGFYNRNELLKTAESTPPGIGHDFTYVIWPTLTGQERAALSGVTFNYPDQCGSHPMNFFANYRNGKPTVCLPISSLRFLSEVCLAQAYFNIQYKNGLRSDNGLMLITNYLSIIRWQWAKIKGSEDYTLLNVLGIDREQVLKNKEVDSLFGKLYSTAIYFIIGHELGHLRFHHLENGKLSDGQSQANEAQADEFALEIFRRIGDPPYGGIVAFFYIIQHFTDVSKEAQQNKLVATHPLNSKRIKALAISLRANAGLYAKSQDNPKRATAQFESIADQLMGFAKAFDDPEIWEIARINGKSGTLEQLRRSAIAGATSKVKSSSLTNSSKFSGDPFLGSWSGTWVNNKKEKMPMTVSFFKLGDLIKGEGKLNDGMDWQITAAETKGRTIYFSWTMGDHYFGTGTLSSDVSGRKLVGSWGTENNGEIKESGQLIFERSN
jgi:hypothetical protein